MPYRATLGTVTARRYRVPSTPTLAVGAAALLVVLLSEATVLLISNKQPRTPTVSQTADEAFQLAGLPQLPQNQVRWSRKAREGDVNYIVVAEVPSNALRPFLETGEFKVESLHMARENDPIPKDGGIVIPDLGWITRRYLQGFEGSKFQEIKDQKGSLNRLIDFSCTQQSCGFVLVLDG